MLGAPSRSSRIVWSADVDPGATPRAVAERTATASVQTTPMRLQRLRDRTAGGVGTMSIGALNASGIQRVVVRAGRSSLGRVAVARSRSGSDPNRDDMAGRSGEPPPGDTLSRRPGAW